MATTPTPCPRCGTALASPRATNALSRYDNTTYVCSSCGTNEAMWNFTHPGEPLPGFDQPLFD